MIKQEVLLCFDRLCFNFDEPKSKLQLSRTELGVIKLESSCSHNSVDFALDDAILVYAFYLSNKYIIILTMYCKRCV